MEQQSKYELFYRRICARFDQERWSLRREDEGLRHAIDEYEAGLLSLLNGLRPRP